MIHLIHIIVLRCFLVLLVGFSAFASDLSAYEKYDEYIYDDNEEDSLYCFSRYAFPTTCEEHFSNNTGIEHTWMEAEDSTIINSFSNYFHAIPKIYDADCCQCYDCNGVKFNLYRGYDYPTDFEASDELRKGHVQSMRGYGKYCINDSDHCECLCWYGGYFRLWNHKYLHFFKHYLQYCSENRNCQCYWPECDLDAMNINNRVYRLLKELSEEGLINQELSPYWQAKEIDFDYFGKIYTDLYYPNSHGMASSLTTYTFFYSQYHQMLLSVAEFIDSNSIKGNPKAIDKVYTTLEAIRDEYISQYNMCIRSHPHPKIYYERGMLRMHSGNIEDALADVNRLMHLAKTDRYKDRLILTTEMYQQEGELYADLGRYDKAITSLSEAIKLDPNNRGAYFSRAQAYFEIGEFEQSIDNYLASNKNGGALKTKLKPSSSIKESILKGLEEGCTESIVDFVPSLCNSVYGLCASLWVFANHPINSTNNFVNACYDIANCVHEFRKNVDLEEIESYPIEIQRLYGQFDRLSESEKGHLVGYLVGKYGIDIFAGGAAIKSVATFKKLKDANRMCMLEMMTLSPVNKEAIITSSLKHKSQRDAFFNKVKINVDRQNKHVPGNHNYASGKSIFQHSDPQSLIDKFAGKGRPTGNRVPGCPDYREKINFEEFIGYHINPKTGTETATSWGEIRYSKDGAHIVPAYPE